MHYREYLVSIRLGATQQDFEIFTAKSTFPGSNSLVLMHTVSDFITVQAGFTSLIISFNTAQRILRQGHEKCFIKQTFHDVTR